MRILRVPTGWKILAPGRSGAVDLEEMAVRCGYRVGEICGELGCSEGYFRRVFLRDVGISPKQWLRDERMIVAKRRLEAGQAWVEVAEALGFSCPASFRREFQGIFRATPGAWGRGVLRRSPFQSVDPPARWGNFR